MRNESGKLSKRGEGEWKEADARVLTEESDTARINKPANQKYGLIKQVFELRYVFMTTEMATGEIVLQNQAAQNCCGCFKQGR